MKKLILALVACFGLSGCAEEVAYAQPVAFNVQSGIVQVCDTNACFPYTTQYYVDTLGNQFYWDAELGCWISARVGYGYYSRGWFVKGFHPYFYSRGFYGRGGYGYRSHSYGGFHGGGHFGGHGGHR